MNQLKKEIMNIVSIPPERKGDTGYLKLTDEEIDKIVELFKKSIQRFIEETKIKEEDVIDEWRCPLCQKKTKGGWKVLYRGHKLCKDGWIEPTGRVALKEIKKKIKQKQAKWLKENL